MIFLEKALGILGAGILLFSLLFSIVDDYINIELEAYNFQFQVLDPVSERIEQTLEPELEPLPVSNSPQGDGTAVVPLLVVFLLFAVSGKAIDFFYWPRVVKVQSKVKLPKFGEQTIDLKMVGPRRLVGRGARLWPAPGGDRDTFSISTGRWFFHIFKIPISIFFLLLLAYIFFIIV